MRAKIFNILLYLWQKYASVTGNEFIKDADITSY